VDRFDTSLFEDTSYQPRWNPASWNVNGTLQGSVLSGSATGPVLGSRTQFVVNNQGPSVPATAGFFSPFDDNTLNNFGPSVNPNGGSRTQLLYLTLPQVNEIPTQITDSIELLEWGAHGGLSNPGLFNSFSLSLSHTSRSADPGVLSTPFAMSAIYNFNADFDNPQNAWLNPGAPPANQAPIQVVAPQIYFTPSLASTYIPFPSLLPTFDFDAKQTAINPVGGQTFRPNLLVDIDVVPPVFTSFNAIEGSLPTSPIPVRRLIGPSGANLAFSADAVAYRMRFTFVPKNASSRSTFHDVGSGPGTISWSSLDLFPDPSTQPVGSVSRVLIEGAPAVSGQQPIGGSGWQEYINRSGVIQPSALSALGSARFVRFQFEFVTNTPTGTAPSWDGFILGGTF
jgi:hypothetical protein